MTKAIRVKKFNTDKSQKSPSTPLQAVFYPSFSFNYSEKTPLRRQCYTVISRPCAGSQSLCQQSSHDPFSLTEDSYRFPMLFQIWFFGRGDNSQCLFPARSYPRTGPGFEGALPPTIPRGSRPTDIASLRPGLRRALWGAPSPTAQPGRARTGDNSRPRRYTALLTWFARSAPSATKTYLSMIIH